ncbi:hypothetical protein AUJ95_07310 [Candidatus Desantisbacteria bacterium CG2_30_40_21]|uniref:Uncharacterized protein n=5 Tax=unclassified Candidatus Desantisiibacteriota TaxID=3106372 RepID=A0A2M7JE69_9BACT|nr:MAG: hypothetical protein AUJ95_07310 [Candidatus Desantisbacteria bacterium CG2_30_40_21]PIP40575.1 MAG: hypothetical protein COX18_06280 [Candidatus Desantisbacteria bacterium CG23_combo_of_CG06-09_8_20_14_all_40_23]PIX17707.1 MAG: hypothetical protein COZ71_01955 [Candidatus Desantisbacteria bacterium CG_4_8_14_3_um_filter_40_12]PIY19875.1 MAG: hypothetical protein COZ13_03055 [Candidatus Desantisbacteria bacterium CG_4_10_14_3_um_filter_40_18]PJB27863.1 MAG: hypothetical protein CO110_11
MKKSKFNCVKMKRCGAETVEKKTRTMTGEEEYKFWIEQTQNLKQLQKLKLQRNKVQYVNI